MILLRRGADGNLALFTMLTRVWRVACGDRAPGYSLKLEFHRRSMMYVVVGCDRRVVYLAGKCWQRE
jgi:hypothetical protein